MVPTQAGPDAVFDRICSLLRGEPHKLRVLAAASTATLGLRAGHYEAYQEARAGGLRGRLQVSRRLSGVHRLAVLAHEAGHHFSRIEGWSDAYQTAIAPGHGDDWRGHPPEQQRAVISEEVKAWQLGIALACDEGFDDRDALVGIGKTDFAEYRGKVDLVDEFDAAVPRIGEALPR